MSIESEGVTSNVELESVLACEGDLRLHEMVNLEGEPTSPKAPAEQERETRLEAIAAEIESVLGTAIMRVAALVAEAHELHRYQHSDGGFEGWVERRLKMSRRTAYNLLDVHKRFGHQSVQILHTLPRSVLYLIAPDSVPEAARTEVIERAQAGENLSHVQVKEIVAGHKSKPLEPNKNRKPRQQAQASHDGGTDRALSDSPSLAPQIRPEQKVKAASPIASTGSAPSPHPVAALADKTIAGGIITATEEPEPVESTVPSGPVILRADADFDSVDLAIDILYSQWTVLARRAIEETKAVGKVRKVHGKADAERLYRDAVRKVKDIHDKAAAWEMRYHHARNADAERTHREIRLCARRTAGQLLIDAAKKRAPVHGDQTPQEGENRYAARPGHARQMGHLQEGKPAMAEGRTDDATGVCGSARGQTYPP